MNDLKKQVPESFYKAGARHEIVEHVGGLIESLKLLPKDLPIEQGFGMGARLVVYNISDPEAVHLSFEEA